MILVFGFWFLDWMRTPPECRRRLIDHPKSRIQNPKSGFTLVEVLIAIALLGALMGAMLAFGFDMLNSRARALDFAWRQRAAATLIERLEMDLAACVAVDHGHPGVRGDATHLSILTRGVASSLAERDSDDADVLGDLQLAEYRFVETQQSLEARRAPFGTAASGEFAFAPIGGELARVRFRYYDGSQWMNSFDSLAIGRLPLAVEVAVWFEDAATREPSQVGAEVAAPRFDENAYARRTDRDAASERRPDRVRVMLIPDAGVEHDATKAAANVPSPSGGAS